MLKQAQIAKLLQGSQPKPSTAGVPRVSISDYGPNRMAVEQGGLELKKEEVQAKLAEVAAKLQDIEATRQRQERTLAQQAQIAEAKLRQAADMGTARNQLAAMKMQLDQQIADKKAAIDKYAADQRAETARQANTIRLLIAQLQQMGKWNVPGGSVGRRRRTAYGTGPNYGGGWMSGPIPFPTL
ncbi:MAG: hypothetical protein M1582_01270 [Actinobacteria bacterium]|nr:hypothetical protein [Actinomycetota bacterium]